MPGHYLFSFQQRVELLLLFCGVFGIEGELWLSWQLQQREAGRGPEWGEFIPLSAGSLRGDVLRTMMEGPEESLGLGRPCEPPSPFPA